jgi:protein AaeX
MLEELHVLGVYMPAALVWAVMAGISAHLLRGLFQRWSWFNLLGHAGIFELALFALLWWGLAVGADVYFNHG